MEETKNYFFHFFPKMEVKEVFLSYWEKTPVFTMVIIIHGRNMPTLLM